MMKPLLMTALSAIVLSTTATTPANAIDENWNSPTDRLNSTTTVIPVAETVRVQGRVTQIDGDRVQFILVDGTTQTYRIDEVQQQQYGLGAGSEVILHVRRLYNNVISVDQIELLQ